MKNYKSEPKPLEFLELVKYYSDRLWREPENPNWAFSRPYMPAYPAVWDGCWTFVLIEDK